MIKINFNWKIIVIGLEILIILIGLIFVTFYHHKPKKETTVKSTTSKIATTSTKTSEVVRSTPEQAVIDFYIAIQENNKQKARTYLSPNVNKEAFKYTLEDISDSSSMYNNNFTFLIEQTKNSLDGKTAFVIDNTTIEGAVIRNTTKLENSGRWLITDSAGVVMSGTPPSDLTTTQSTELDRTLLIIEGPCELYITSPEGTHEGYSTSNGSTVNGIEDVDYFSSPSSLKKTMTITDLVGFWELQVVGTNVGDYALTARVIDPRVQVDNTTKGNCTKGSVQDYFLLYPKEVGKQIEITAVK